MVRIEAYPVHQSMEQCKPGDLDGRGVWLAHTGPEPRFTTATEVPKPADTHHKSLGSRGAKTHVLGGVQLDLLRKHQYGLEYIYAEQLRNGEFSDAISYPHLLTISRSQRSYPLKMLSKTSHHHLA
jgi:hypothetical protein